MSSTATLPSTADRRAAARLCIHRSTAPPDAGSATDASSTSNPVANISGRTTRSTASTPASRLSIPESVRSTDSATISCCTIAISIFSSIFLLVASTKLVHFNRLLSIRMHKKRYLCRLNVWRLQYEYRNNPRNKRSQTAIWNHRKLPSPDGGCGTRPASGADRPVGAYQR